MPNCGRSPVPVYIAYGGDMLPGFREFVRLEFDGVVGLESILPLLKLEVAEFEAVLGQPVEFGPVTDRPDHVWRVRVDPNAQAAELHADMASRSLLSIIPSTDAFGDSLNLLHSLAYDAATSLTWSEAPTYEAVADRIRAEIAMIYPYLELRGLDWGQICARHAGIYELTGEAFWRAASRWVAELGDAHTSIGRIGPRHNPPYIAMMTEVGAKLIDVPTDSPAWEAGVRPGWLIPVEDPALWLATTGASPQHHAMVSARRFLTVWGAARTFHATGPGGQGATWAERPRHREPVEVTGGTIRIRAFTPAVPTQVAAALAGLTDCGEVTLDLRGNIGGSLVAAAETRRLFARGPDQCARVQFTTGTGKLASAQPLFVEPGPATFPGRVRVLVDAMTYSAAEDFLHPLVGLDHVTIVGGPTGGGSGRPHSRPLKDGYLLNVSTAITYTRHGQPIEFRGLQDSER